MSKTMKYQNGVVSDLI